MKVYILPIPPSLQPDHQDFIWPPGNQDYGVEQDFLAWLRIQSDLLTTDATQADRMYLPIFWNRFYMNHPGDAHTEDVELMRQGVAKAMLDPCRTFTVCEFDPYFLMRHVDLDGVTVFTANRMGPRGIDIPLLCRELRFIEPAQSRRWRASFIGHNATHKTRADMFAALKDCKGCHIEAGNRGVGYFVDLLHTSYIALAPRGDGGQSYRFYEAMQLGVVPMLIGEPDTRPFPDVIDWASCSLYRENCDGLHGFIRGYDTGTLVKMGQQARMVYGEHLAYGRWCRHVVSILEDL